MTLKLSSELGIYNTQYVKKIMLQSKFKSWDFFLFPLWLLLILARMIESRCKHRRY